MEAAYDVAEPDVLTYGEALARRIPRSRLRGSSAVHLTHDAYRLGEAPTTPWDLVHAIARNVPDAVVNSVTAAQRHGFRLPTRLEQDTIAYVNRPQKSGRIIRAGVHCSRRKYTPDQVQELDGVAVARPLQTLYEIAPKLKPDELVVAADGLVNFHEVGYGAGTPPLVAMDDFQTFVRNHSGLRDIARFTHQLRRVRVGSDSGAETRLRLMLEDHGIEGLALGHPVFDAFGNLLFQADLADAGLRISLQYEGIHHDAPGQRERDIVRARRTEGAGWIEVRISATDMTSTQWYQGRLWPKPVALYLEAVDRARSGRRLR